MNLSPQEITLRLNTASLLVNDARARALVVFNDMDQPLVGLVRFAARFPVRADAYPQPVIVRNDRRFVLPSRFARSVIETDASLSPGYVWWDTELEFVTDLIPARGWRTFSATFGVSPESRSEDRLYWDGDAPPFLPLLVLETGSHEGQLPITSPEGAFSATI
jgi:hypothetical protein